MTQTLEGQIEQMERIANQEIGEDVDYPHQFDYKRGGKIVAEHALPLIKELQEKNDLLQLDFNAAQEIMGGMNKEIWELKKQNKSWQEMVDSTNQTNQALCKRLTDAWDKEEKGIRRVISDALQFIKIWKKH